MNNEDGYLLYSAMTIIIVCIPIILICVLLGIGSPSHSSTPSSSDLQYASYTLGGNHTGFLVFFNDGTGFGEINGTRSGKFTWETTGGIHFDASVRGKIRYWGYEIDTILFPENLTMISPEFPGTYAILKGGTT